MSHISIKPLTPDLADDYFDFFENRPFTDGSPYRCYCQVYQMTREQYNAAFDGITDGAELGRASREVAERQIASGVLRGYLAFADGVAIGWCNANDKTNYPAEPYYVDVRLFHAPAEKREKAVICFEIAPEFRGKGVATALLERVCADAKADGYTAVEGFPTVREERYEWDFSGPVRLYEKVGFVEVDRLDERVVMRKVFERNIEDDICEALTGDAQANALVFAAHLRALDMEFERGTGYWEDKRYWMIEHSDEYVCFVLINGYGEKAHKDEPDGWIIWSDDYSSDIFSNFPLDENEKQTAWEHIDFCANCGSCGGGTRKMIFGKDFENVCTTIFRFENPDAESVECAKKLVEIRKNEIDGKRD